MSAFGRVFAVLLLIIPLLACEQPTPEQPQADTRHELTTPPQPTENSATVAPEQPQASAHDESTTPPQPTKDSASVEPEQFQEGTQYQLVTPAQPTDSGTNVEVVEMFWYGCPHCFHLEPALTEWLKHKPANVTFIRAPAVLNPSWELLARAYFAADDLGVGDKIHGPLFHAIHEQHAAMNTDKDVIAFFVAQGVAEADVRDAMISFSAETKLRRARQMGERYGLTGVPAVIVNGKYRVNTSTAGSTENIIKVLDFLIKKESNAAHAK